MLSLDADVLRVAQKVREVGRALDERFLDKSELIRLLLVTLVAGEHMLIVGPPGTAKSALVRQFARLIDARYFEYLLTRFTEPNEMFGPVDIKAFREGTLHAPGRGHAARRRDRVPRRDLQVELGDPELAAQHPQRAPVLHGRRQHPGAAVSLFAASNEVPNDEALGARVRPLPRARAVGQPRQLPLPRPASSAACAARSRPARDGGGEAAVEGAARPLVSLAEIRLLKAQLAQHLQFPEDFLARYKGLVFQIRSEGVTLTDRRVVKLLKLFAASALFDGRPTVDDGDFFVLRHIWNNVDQVPILDDIVGPVLERLLPRPSRGARAPAAARAISTASSPSWA